jgi:nucleoside-diphosphate-sugar epimerase
MADTMNLIKDITQSDVQFITEDVRLRPKYSEVFRLKGDNTLIANLTGWSPEYTLSQGLKDTIHWFKNPEYLKKYKPITIQLVNLFLTKKRTTNNCTAIY